MWQVKRIIKEDGYIIGNIDATIIAQKPKMSPHIPEMRRIIADALVIEEDRVNIKATTEEGLGFTGEGLGISCQAICLLETVDNYAYRDMAMDEFSAEETGCGCTSCPVGKK